MNVSFYTLGCKVNQYETECMAEQFAKHGFKYAEPTEQTDVFVINSCTVTAESDRKTRQTLRRARKKYPNAVIVLAGCMPQAFPGVAEELFEADVIVGNTSPAELPVLVLRFLQNGQRIVRISEHNRSEKFTTPCIKNFSAHTRAFMKIQDGCERYCTYCIIPSARGVVRSKSIEEIKREAEDLARAGFLEIVLVGINLTSFGKDTGHNLCDAVETVAKVEGIRRVRLGSLEPDHMSDEMLSRLSKIDKFCEQFHLSLQSGCDATLRRMNRHYDGAYYMDLVTRIRRIFTNAAITTDIMVGFAGEDESEFRANLDFARRVGFAKTHVFAYSRRAGTVAYGLPNQVTRVEKERRSREMIELSRESEKQFLSAQTGKKMSVLFEIKDNDIYSGYTGNYTYVKVHSETDLTGSIANVVITAAYDDYCEGSIVE